MDVMALQALRVDASIHVSSARTCVAKLASPTRIAAVTRLIDFSSGQDAVPARLAELLVLARRADGRAASQAIPNGGPLLLRGNVLHEDLFAARLVERAQVRIKIVRVRIGAAPGVDPGHRGIRLERQTLREHGDPAAALGRLLGALVDLV